MRLGWSSRLYPLDAGDFASVPDYSGPAIPASDLPDDPVVLFIRPGEPDALVRGREAISAAGGGTVDVRIVFLPSISKWNILYTLVRALRNRRRYECSGVYHIATDAVRQMGLERAVRTLDAPHERGSVDRKAKMAKLEKSLRENGYDDARPINVMLCRSHGVEDSLRQGHHRISACVECGIKKMAVHFSAAGALPRCLARFVAKPRVKNGVLRNSIGSRIGETVARLVPAGDAAGVSDFIVVPENGRRFVVKLVSDGEAAAKLASSGKRLKGRGPVSGKDFLEVGGRYALAFEYDSGSSLRSSVSLAAGVAPVVLVPLLVGGAVAFDVAVSRTAFGGESLVTWCQAFCSAASAAIMGFLAVAERRARAGYGIVSALLFASGAYECLRDMTPLSPGAAAAAACASGAAAATAFFALSRRSFLRGLKRILASRGFLAIPFAVIVVPVAVKIISSKAFWSALGLEADEVRSVRNAVREGSELLCVAVLLGWAVSFLIERTSQWRFRK